MYPGSITPSNADTPSALDNLISLAPDAACETNKKSKLSIRSVLRQFATVGRTTRSSTSYGTGKIIESLCNIHETSLLATLIFLEIQHYGSKLDISKLKEASKRDLAPIIYNRVRSLLPHTCQTCSVPYTVPLRDEDAHLRLYCHGCGLPSHTCWVKSGLDSIKSNQVWLCEECYVTTSSLLKFLSPPSVPSAHDISAQPAHIHPPTTTDLGQTSTPADIEQTTVPADPDLTSTPTDSGQTTSPTESGQTTSPTESGQTITSTDSGQTTSSSDLELTSTSADSGQTDQHIRVDHGTSLAPPQSLADQPTSSPQAKQTIPATQPNKPGFKICHYLKRGSCKYGKSGRRNGTCPLNHPKQCLAFVKNGSTLSLGCQKGPECHLWHPTYFCHNSIREKKCLNDNCQYYHQKGCQRSEHYQSQTLQNFQIRRDSKQLWPENQPDMYQTSSSVYHDQLWENNLPWQGYNTPLPKTGYSKPRMAPHHLQETQRLLWQLQHSLQNLNPVLHRHF